MNRIVIILLLLSPSLGFSQQMKEEISKKELRKNRPSFISVSVGSSSSSFRDFATSPLTYRGRTNYISVSKSKVDLKRETELGLDYSFGNLGTNFNEHNAASSLKTVALFYSRLYKLNKLSTEKINTKVGGMFHTSANLRINPSLQNNSAGVEIIPTLFASIKVSKDISRTKAFEKKFLFMKFKFPVRKRDIAFRLNLGVLNSSYRNGFVYSGQSGVLNKPKLFDNYYYSVSGFRMNTVLDYKVYMKNKNAFKLSYMWDAYKTSSKYDSFEMAQHTIKFTLMFNTNNR